MTGGVTPDGVALVKGLQGDDPRYYKVTACAKHYAVHSGPEALRHRFDARVSPRDLWETYLPAFEALVREAKVESVMGAYNRVYGESASGSKLLLRPRPLLLQGHHPTVRHRPTPRRRPLPGDGVPAGHRGVRSTSGGGKDQEGDTHQSQAASGSASRQTGRPASDGEEAHGCGRHQPLA